MSISKKTILCPKESLFSGHRKAALEAFRQFVFNPYSPTTVEDRSCSIDHGKFSRPVCAAKNYVCSLSNCSTSQSSEAQKRGPSHSFSKYFSSGYSQQIYTSDQGTHQMDSLLGFRGLICSKARSFYLHRNRFQVPFPSLEITRIQSPIRLECAPTNQRAIHNVPVLCWCTTHFKNRQWRLLRISLSFTFQCTYIVYFSTNALLVFNTAH